jgi:hypothetical protein
LQLSKIFLCCYFLFIHFFSSFEYSLRTSKGLKVVANTKSVAVDPSCTPSIVYRALGLRACLELNPFRSLQLGSRPSYPITVSLIRTIALDVGGNGGGLATLTKPHRQTRACIEYDATR